MDIEQAITQAELRAAPLDQLLALLTPDQVRLLVQHSMRQRQQASAKARWAKYSPKARAARMRAMALTRHRNGKRPQGSANLSGRSLAAIARQYAPVWRKEQMRVLRSEIGVSHYRMAQLVGSVASSTPKAWEHGTKIPNKAAQRLIWLLARTLRGQPTDLQALLTWGRSDRFRKQVPVQPAPESSPKA